MRQDERSCFGGFLYRYLHINLVLFVVDLKKTPLWCSFFKYLQGTGTAGGTSTTMVTSLSPHIPTQHTPPAALKSMTSGFQNTADQSACQMKSVFVPSSSPYDSSSTARSQTSAIVANGQVTQNDPFLVGCVDSIDKQVK